MSGEEQFQLCPNCKIGRLRPTGLAATSSDPQTNRVTNDLRGYKCDSCGYPEGGQAKVVAVNEQEAIRDTITITSSPAATTAAAQAAAEAAETAAEEEGKERLIKLRDTGDDNEMVAVREEEKEDTEEDL